jgi:hypothetical protein
LPTIVLPQKACPITGIPNPNAFRKPFRRSREISRKRTSVQPLLIDQQWGSIMSKILNFIFSHYVGLFFAGVVFVSTGAQADSARALNVAAAESSGSQPTPATQSPAAVAPVSETTKPTQPIAIKHLSKREAQLVRELHQHGIYW